MISRTFEKTIRKEHMNSVIFGGKGVRNLEWMNVKSVKIKYGNETKKDGEQPESKRNMKSRVITTEAVVCNKRFL